MTVIHTVYYIPHLYAIDGLFL